MRATPRRSRKIAAGALRSAARLLALLTLCAGVFAPLPALASGFEVLSIEGCTPIDPVWGCYGEQITVRLRFENDRRLPLSAIAAIATSDDYGIHFFANSSSVASLLHDICLPSVGCYGGFQNVAVPSYLEPNGDLRFLLAYAIGMLHSGDGIDSPGFDGIVGGDDAQFEITFTTSALGAARVTFELDLLTAEPPISDAFRDSMKAEIMVYSDFHSPHVVVPESATPVLLTFGAIGVASMSGRRRVRRPARARVSST